MFFILSKILSFLFMPLSWVFILLILSFVWHKWAKKFRIAAFITLYLFSNSFLLNEVNRWWEVPITLDEELDKYEAGVVLGGYAYYSIPERRITFRESGDRLFQGIRLLETGVIDHMVVSGGSGYVLYPDLKEGLFVAEYLDQINIPKRKIWLETESRNTKENASYTAALLEEKEAHKQTLVLITSAYHMRRAIACFEKQGLSVIPYSTDRQVSDEITLDAILLPNPKALAFWNVLIHEWIGYLSYWVMGYI